MPLDPAIADRANGQIIDEDWFNFIKTNLEDHDTRLIALETLVRQIQFKIEDFYYDFATSSTLPITNVMNFKLLEDITIIDCQLWVDINGSAGTNEVDIQFKRGAGAWTSILTTKPSVGFGSGSNFTSANGVLNNAFNDLLADDLLRLDVTNLQTDGFGFAALLDYQRTI